MRRINRVQRLARREEKDIVKRIFFLSVVSVILIFILLTVGVTALGKFAEVLDIFFKDSGQQVEEVEISAPILNSAPDSTNDEKFTVSGFSSIGEKVEIYHDGEKLGETTFESGKFSYDLILKSGENEINAKTVSGQTVSDFSSPVIINLDKTEPNLEVTNPTQDQSFYSENRIKVEGTTVPDAQVFVNGFLANVEGDGRFETTITLTEGENQLEIKTLDDAGNTRVEKLKVNFRK